MLDPRGKDRTLYLAVTESVWRVVFADAFGDILIDERAIRIVTFEPKSQEIVQWIP